MIGVLFFICKLLSFTDQMRQNHVQRDRIRPENLRTQALAVPQTKRLSLNITALKIHHAARQSFTQHRRHRAIV